MADGMEDSNVPVGSDLVPGERLMPGVTLNVACGGLADSGQATHFVSTAA